MKRKCRKEKVVSIVRWNCSGFVLISSSEMKIFTKGTAYNIWVSWSRSKDIWWQTIVFPAGTWRGNDAELTSMRCNASTSVWRGFSFISPPDYDYGRAIRIHLKRSPDLTRNTSGVFLPYVHDYTIFLHSAKICSNNPLTKYYCVFANLRKWCWYMY